MKYCKRSSRKALSNQYAKYSCVFNTLNNMFAELL